MFVEHLTIMCLSCGVSVIAYAQAQAENRPYGQDEVTPDSLAGNFPSVCDTMACFRPLMSNGGNVSLGGPETWSAAELKNKCQ